MSSANKTLGLQIEQSFLEAEKTCSSPWVLDFTRHLPGVSINFKELMIILAAVSCLLNILVSMYLVCGHLFHWTNPAEQKQFIRVIVFVPFASICAFFSIWFYPAAGFITPARQCYEGNAITALFLLYVHYLVPRESERASFFHNLERRWITGSKKGDKGSLRWFRILWIMVFQVTITRIGTVVAQEILYGMTCPLSLVRLHGTLAIQVIQGTSTGIAVAGVIQFERRLQKELQPIQPLFKLTSFKVLVGLEATQSILFSSLAEKGVLYPKEPYHVSWNDFAKGLPEFVLIWELTVMVILFTRSFHYDGYRRACRNGAQVVASPVAALASSFAPRDIVRGVAYMFTSFTPSTFMEGDARAAPQARSWLHDDVEKRDNSVHPSERFDQL